MVRWTTDFNYDEVEKHVHHKIEYTWKPRKVCNFICKQNFITQGENVIVCSQSRFESAVDIVDW